MAATALPLVRVLLMTSNGTGMGHLTRMLAMATRSSDAIEPFFFSMSSAVPVVARYGYGWEYCPSQDELDVDVAEWNALFDDRLTEVIERYQPQVLVFDGVVPYNGLQTARRRFPDLICVWSRRSMWRRGVGRRWLHRSSWFDLVIEPGEFAAAADRGPTVGRIDAVGVRPITLLDSDDLLERGQARAELGIEESTKAVLVTLGGGNLNDITSDLDVVADVVRHRPDWQVYATQAPITRSGAPARDDIRSLSVYPLSRYLAAFDVAVVACGYNAYHEAILAGTPTIFVPKPKNTDDQHARAAYAAERGLGVAVDEVTPELIGKALDRLIDPGEAARVRQQCAEQYPGNGAADAMALIEDLLVQRGVLT
jgi:UDP:flavonoid glycosyltransferase YjiC (YdhE family)